jgi:hypothetical protein
VSFTETPTTVRVSPELSKSANGYLTFLSRERCDYLKAYLEERLRGGERLTPDSDLLHPDRASGHFFRTLNHGDAIRTANRAAGFKWRPYVLRAYFEPQLQLAESKGKIAHDYRVFGWATPGAWTSGTLPTRAGSCRSFLRTRGRRTAGAGPSYRPGRAGPTPRETSSTVGA